MFTRTTVASHIQMQNQGQNERDFITIYAGSADGKVLKVGVSSNDYGEVNTLSKYFVFPFWCPTF